MDERYKRMRLREDGFLEITLKRVKDFDDYIYQQMQKDTGCIPCVRDPRTKSKLYYDTKGYVSLRTYMQSYTFERHESCCFMIYILESMIKVNTTKPVCMDIDHIYISGDGGLLRFLVIPVAIEQWVFQKEESHLFIQQIINEIKLTEGYDAVGYLAYMQRYEEVTLPMLLQGLHDIEDGIRHKPTFIEKLLHLHEDTTYVIKNIPAPKPYPMLQSVEQIMEEEASYPKVERKKETRHETVALLQRSEDSYVLVDDATGENLALCKAMWTIGRSKDNDLCIPEPYISLHHACLHTSTNELEDLSSSNGTYVNERKIKKQLLHERDHIRFANASYHFVRK